jgi:hypothetical protein
LPIARFATAIGRHPLTVVPHPKVQAVIEKQQQPGQHFTGKFHYHADLVRAIADDLGEGEQSLGPVLARITSALPSRCARPTSSGVAP